MDDWIVRQQQQDLIRQQQMQQDLFQQQQVQQNLVQQQMQQNLAQQQAQQPDPLGQQRGQEDPARQQLERQRANEEIRIGGLVSNYNPAYQSSPFDVPGSENRPQEELERQNQRLQEDLFRQRQAQDALTQQQQQELIRQQQQVQGDVVGQQQVQDGLTRQQQQESLIRQQQAQDYLVSQQRAQEDFIRQQQGQGDPIGQQQQQDFIRQQQQSQEDFIRQQNDSLGQQRGQEDPARQQLERQRANEEIRIGGLVSNYNPAYQSSPFDVPGSENRPQEELERQNQRLQEDLFRQRQAQDSFVREQQNIRDETGRYQIRSPSADELQQAAKAYHGTFGETPAITSLWERATHDMRSYKDGAQRAFWDLVNNDGSSAAREVRRVLELAGFELQGGARAPKLRAETYEELRPEDAGRRNADLTLSIDHIVPQSDKEGKGRTLDPDNLRFMLLRDNSTLGAWNKDKAQEKADTGFSFARPLSHAEQQAFRERVEALLRSRRR